jgi:hypothetical protein
MDFFLSLLSSNIKKERAKILNMLRYYIILGPPQSTLLIKYSKYTPH